MWSVGQRGIFQSPSTFSPIVFDLFLKYLTTRPLSAAPVMSYAQLESLINKWSSELEDQERHFLQQATQVNAWDRMLVENGEKVARHYTSRPGNLYADLELHILTQRVTTHKKCNNRQVCQAGQKNFIQAQCFYINIKASGKVKKGSWGGLPRLLPQIRRCKLQCGTKVDELQNSARWKGSMVLLFRSFPPLGAH